MSATLNNLALRRLRYPQEHEAVAALLAQAALPDPKVVETIDAMAADIAGRGVEALEEYTRRFDNVDLQGRLRVSAQEIEAAVQVTPAPVRDAIAAAAERLRRFHMRGKPVSWTYKEGNATLGQLVRPIERVGVYAPGGTAAYVSTVLMDVIPAQVAGCPRIALCSSPKADLDGGITPVILAACHLLGVDEVYRLGGAQAVMAMALGVPGMPPVDMICGPGNVWVTQAKRWAQNTGRVKIDKLAGPTEVLIIADDTARPDIVAADMLAQAEHDEASRAILVTTHPALVEQVEIALREQLATLPRQAIAQPSIRDHGLAITTDSLQQACEVSNMVAPEHLQVLTRDPASLVDQLTHAGAIFLGPYSPEAMGDYVAGPNHVLPTVGQARFASPLMVADFVKYTSLMELDRELFEALADTTAILARAEGLDGHARSVQARRDGTDLG